jgi:putative restriction endonuclease
MSRWTRENLLYRINAINFWKNKKIGERAPHKPLLILYALGQLLSEGKNQIRFSEFYDPFARLLEEFGPPRKSYHPEYPFWFLRTEQFWEIDPKDGWQLKTAGSSPTKSELLRRNTIGSFLPEVQEMFVNHPTLASEVISLLLNNHFPESIHEDILAAVHLEQVLIAKPRRDPRFREEVLRAYGYRCAVCGFDLRLDNVPLALDAAHIRWHQALGPSIASNGLALCSLHHKLFDRGAFSLSDGLELQISQRVNGSNGLVEALLRFRGTSIATPNMKKARPDIGNVRWHRHEVFHAPVGEWVLTA